MIDQLRKLIRTVDPASLTIADRQALLDLFLAASEAQDLKNSGGGGLPRCDQLGLLSLFAESAAQFPNQLAI
jgi:hypothetical protein